MCVACWHSEVYLLLRTCFESPSRTLFYFPIMKIVQTIQLLSTESFSEHCSDYKDCPSMSSSFLMVLLMIPCCNTRNPVSCLFHLGWCWLISSNSSCMYTTHFLFSHWSEFCFPITLSAVQSMDHSFDGISINVEEGAYQRKSHSWHFRQILQFVRKGIKNEANMHCLFTVWLLLSM